MQKPLDRTVQLTAQQIAFLNVGDQYCSHYYTDPKAWDEWGIKAEVGSTKTTIQERLAILRKKIQKK